MYQQLSSQPQPQQTYTQTRGPFQPTKPVPLQQRPVGQEMNVQQTNPLEYSHSGLVLNPQLLNTAPTNNNVTGGQRLMTPGMISAAASAAQVAYYTAYSGNVVSQQPKPAQQPIIIINVFQAPQQVSSVMNNMPSYQQPTNIVQSQQPALFSHQQHEQGKHQVQNKFTNNLVIPPHNYNQSPSQYYNYQNASQPNQVSSASIIAQTASQIHQISVRNQNIDKKFQPVYRPQETQQQTQTMITAQQQVPRAAVIHPIIVSNSQRDRFLEGHRLNSRINMQTQNQNELAPANSINKIMEKDERILNDQCVQNGNQYNIKESNNSHLHNGENSTQADRPNVSQINMQKRKGRKSKLKITECSHTDRKYFAKGLCFNCYHMRGRDKRAPCHPERRFYARGCCRSCYVQKFFRHKSNYNNIAAINETNTGNNDIIPQQN